MNEKFYVFLNRDFEINLRAGTEEYQQAYREVCRQICAAMRQWIFNIDAKAKITAIEGDDDAGDVFEVDAKSSVKRRLEAEPSLGWLEGVQSVDEPLIYEC